MRAVCYFLIHTERISATYRTHNGRRKGGVGRWQVGHLSKARLVNITYSGVEVTNSMDIGIQPAAGMR